MTVFKREAAPDLHDDTPVKEQGRQYRKLVREALKEEADGKKPKFNPEEWGL